MPRRTILLALGGVVAIAAAWAWMGSDLPPFGEPPLPPEAVGPPPGRWHWIPAPPPAAGEPDLSPEERARFVSLPYSAGGRRAEAGAPGGVVRWDRERAAPGINLYVSGHGPEAVLIDMAGRELGRWRYPFARAFPGRAPTPDTAFFRRAALLPDGRLLALYQAGGLIELDRRSRLLSAYPGSFYNDFFAAPDGRVWTLSKQARPVAGAEPPAWVLEDFLAAIERYWNDLVDSASVSSALLERLRDAVDASGAELHAFVLPHLHDRYLYDPTWPAPEGIETDGYRTYGSLRLAECGERLGFATFAVDEALLRAVRSGQNLDCGDEHLNAHGNQVVGVAVAEVLRGVLAGH
jgi:hypothetical protein